MAKKISFRRIERSLAPGHTMVRYHLNETPEDTGFRMVATRHGIELLGDSGTISSHPDLQELALNVAKVWQEYERLKREWGQENDPLASGRGSGIIRGTLGGSGESVPVAQAQAEKEEAPRPEEAGDPR